MAAACNDPTGHSRWPSCVISQSAYISHFTPQGTGWDPFGYSLYCSASTGHLLCACTECGISTKIGVRQRAAGHIGQMRGELGGHTVVFSSAPRRVDGGRPVLAREAGPAASVSVAAAVGPDGWARRPRRRAKGVRQACKILAGPAATRAMGDARLLPLAAFASPEANAKLGQRRQANEARLLELYCQGRLWHADAARCTGGCFAVLV